MNRLKRLVAQITYPRFVALVIGAFLLWTMPKLVNSGFAYATGESLWLQIIHRPGNEFTLVPYSEMEVRHNGERFSEPRPISGLEEIRLQGETLCDPRGARVRLEERPSYVKYFGYPPGRYQPRHLISFKVVTVGNAPFEPCQAEEKGVVVGWTSNDPSRVWRLTGEEVWQDLVAKNKK